MGLIQETIPVASVITDPSKLIMALPATILGVGTAAKSFTIVHQSEMGVRTRRGAPMFKPEINEMIASDIGGLPKDECRELVKNRIDELPETERDKGIYQIVGQGVVWLVPFIDRVVRINVADQTTPLGDFPLESEENRQVSIDSSITWNVRHDGDNPYKALFNINNEKEANLKDQTRELEQTVSRICASGLGRVLRGRSYDNLLNFDRVEITNCTQAICYDDLLQYGVNLSEVWLDPIVRTPAERLAQAIQGNPDSPNAGMIVGAAATAGKDTGQLLHLATPPQDAA